MDIVDKYTLKALIKKGEGYEKKPYLDSKHIPTIGIGSNLQNEWTKERVESWGIDYDILIEQAAFKNEEDKTLELSDEQVSTLFERDLNIAINDAESIYLDFATYDKARQATIIDMTFNLGKTRYLGFKKMIAAIKVRDWETAAAEMIDSHWYQQTDARAKRNVRIMKTGVLPASVILEAAFDRMMDQNTIPGSGGNGNTGKEFVKEFKENSKENAKEGFKELSKEVAKELSKELGKELQKESNKELGKESGKEFAKEQTKESMKEITKEIGKEASKEGGKESFKEGKDFAKEGGKESKEKDGKESKEKDSKESKEKDNKEHKEKDGKEHKEKDGKEQKEKDSKEHKEKDSKESKEKDSKESKEKDNKESKEKDGDTGKEMSDKGQKDNDTGKEMSDKGYKDGLDMPGGPYPGFRPPRDWPPIRGPIVPPWYDNGTPPRIRDAFWESITL